jgi:hypothetical protein
MSRDEKAWLPQLLPKTLVIYKTNIVYDDYKYEVWSVYDNDT